MNGPRFKRVYCVFSDSNKFNSILVSTPVLFFTVGRLWRESSSLKPFLWGPFLKVSGLVWHFSNFPAGASLDMSDTIVSGLLHLVCFFLFYNCRSRTRFPSHKYTWVLLNLWLLILRTLFECWGALLQMRCVGLELLYLDFALCVSWVLRDLLMNQITQTTQITSINVFIKQ